MPGLLWTPAALGSRVKRWYRADSLTQSGGAVSSMTDLSGTGGTNANAVQATGANQPAYSATGWDGTLPGVTFDGVNDFLQFDFDSALTAPFAFLIVMKNYTGGSGNNDLWRSTAADGPASYRSGGGTSWTMFGPGGGFLDDATAYAGNTPTLRMDVFDSSGGLISNGAYRSGTANTGNAGSSTVSTTLGAMAGFGSYTGITFTEAAWILGPFTSLEYDLLEGYTHWQWSITSRLPSNHRFKSGPPLLQAPDGPVCSIRNPLLRM